jgi:thioredoxin 1
VKVNVDENNELASQFQVSSIPAVFIIKDWEHLDTVIWANPKNIYQWKIDKCLG